MSSVLEEMRAVLDGDEELLHYGTKRHSGRYPYGSGEDPYQHGGDFLSRVEELQNRPGGWAETAENVQKEFGMKLEEYRNEKHWANYTRKEQLVQKGLSLREKGMGNSAIARELGLPNESSVRSMLDPKAVSKMQASKKVAEFLKEQVDAKGMLDIGKDTEKFIVVGEGVDKTLGVTRTKLDQAIYALEAEGYVTYPARIEQPTNKGNWTTQLVLCKPGTPYGDVYNHPDKIHTIEDFKSSDGGESFQKKFTYPASLDSKRLMVRYADDVGTDGFKGIEKDGIIELRRGVKDLSLEGTKYAQVRILVDGTHYLKGMAVYSDDMPPGVDVIFNTNKKSNVPALGPKDNTVLKRIKEDPENPFGSLIKDADKGGQYWYDDPKSGEKKLGLINKKADEGDWSEWTDALPSQFLSKQNKELIKRQLNLAANERHEEFERICEINNPTIKKHLLKSFAEDCDGAAVNLKAAALPKQKYHVIIPVNSLKDTEVYAPGYDDGTKLALIRYPHAGIFEIPVLTVNNKNALGKKLLGKDTMDGIGINSKIAEQLSGADFDGDTVMAIPTDYGNIKISRSPYLKELKGFDAKVEYATHVGEDGKRYNDRGDKVPILPKQRVGYEMGVISNLITDMTLAGGASPDEMARAVKHSMVVIDAEKHKLDYKRSEVENNIAALKAKYQITVKEDGELKTGGAATIISRAKSPEKVPKRRGQGIIDKETGELTYLPALPDDLHYVKITKNKKGLNTIRTTDGKTIKYDPDDPEAVEKYKPVRRFNDDGTVSYTNKAGDISYKVETRTQDSTKMAEAKDAYSLVSAARHPAELLYADYANNMKALANTARKEMVTTGNIEYKKSAAETYKKEVDSLLARLNEAEKNSVRERQAVRLATAEIRSKKASNPDMEKGDLRKISQKAMSKARQEAGSVSRRDRNILITDREWEAIQAGAVRETTLRRILNNADIDDLRQRATPRDSKAISAGKAARITNLSATGNYTIAEIANQVGLSVTTVKKYLKGVD